MIKPQKTRCHANCISVRKIYWLSVGVLDKPGGGERVILEGLSHLTAQGFETSLLVVEKHHETGGLFNGKYSPKIIELSRGNNQATGQRQPRLRRWFRVRINLQSLIRRMQQGDILLANGADECVMIQSSRVFAFFKKPRYHVFIHGSKFQFEEDMTKYAAVYRKGFLSVWNSDEVYRKLISKSMPPMKIGSRIALELRELFRFWAVRKSRTVFVLSNKTRREIEMLFGHKNVAVVVTGGFSEGELRNNRRLDSATDRKVGVARVFFSLCRLVKKKRVDFILMAFSRYRQNEHDENCLLIVGGSGPELDNLKKLAVELGVESSVVFTGFIPESELHRYFSMCDVFLQTDNADYDLAVMHALSYLKKVVVTKQYDFPETLHKTRSLVYAAQNDIADFAAMMVEAVHSPALSDVDSILSELTEITWDQYFQKIVQVGNQNVK